MQGINIAPDLFVFLDVRLWGCGESQTVKRCQQRLPLIVESSDQVL
jgi:hypothetical protein